MQHHSAGVTAVDIPLGAGAPPDRLVAVTGGASGRRAAARIGVTGR
ncbi:hypothetical protein AB0I54_41230 [Streptomyces sp. NPDC050625]